MTRTEADRFHGHLDLHQAAVVLRWEKRDRRGLDRLRELMRRRENESGRQIIFQRCPQGKCYTTVPVLRNAFAECFDWKDHTAEMLRESQEEQAEAFKRQTMLLRALGARLGALEKIVAELRRRQSVCI